MLSGPSGARHLPRVRRSIDLGDEAALRAWKVALSLVLSSPQSDGLGALLPNGRRLKPRSIQTGPLANRASVRLPQLIAATQECAVDRAVAAAAPLIGAGPGLTPSWDDLLVGYICGLRASLSVHKGTRAHFLDRFGQAVLQASFRTTDVSRQYIERAARGESPAWIEDVLDAIAWGDAAAARQTTHHAMAIGTTSGTDMMLGVMLGSAIWQRNAPAEALLSVLSCNKALAPGICPIENHAAH